MRYLQLITTSIALIFSIGINAQEAVPAAGGDAVGSGGSSSFTVGQVVYTTHTGTNGSVAQGVQQSYEISVITGVNETEILLEMSVYPNPTTNYLQLKVEDEALEALSFQLSDLQGKVIENKKVTTTTSNITMEALPKAIYFLSVIKNNKPVKTFRVIKQ